MKLLQALLCLALISAGQAARSQGLKALFDNTKNETAGNADWIIDIHQPVPSPAQSGITPSSPGTFWTGAISSWGVDLVKKGFTVHTLTASSGITYGNASNAYDLSNYNVFIVCEPQGPFSAAEKAAIASFVQHGGGLFMVADHNGSDRNSDGWDSPMVWNDLRSDTLFGIHFQSTSETNNNISQVATNVAPASDPVIVGPAGTVTSLSYHNGTTMNLLTAVNPAAAGHVWMNAASHGNTQVMAATSRYGLGKVAGVGDSSPADDSTGQSGNSLFNGWKEPGATDDILFLNLTLWLATSDPPAQVVLVSPADSAANVTVPVPFLWRAAAGAANYEFDLSASASFSPLVASDSTLTDTSYAAGGLAANSAYYWRVRAKNGAGWGAFSDGRTFTAAGPSSFTITASAGPGGSIAPEGAVSVAAGSDRTFVLTPDTGRHVDSLIVDAAPVPAAPSYTFTNVAGDHTIRAAFAIDTFTVTATSGAHGTISPLGVLSVAYDSSIVFTATPDSGYGIDTIRIDGSPLDSAVSPFTLSAIASDHSVGVTFRRLGTVTVVISLKSHWNLVSLPLLVDDPSAASLFPSAQTKAFGYDQAYQIAETLSAGRGYWMEFGHDLQVSQTGDPEGEDSIGVAAGWNLIGSITAAVPVSSIGADPPGLVVSRFFGYAGGYVAADTIVPGLGYWVKASQGGTLYLSSNPSPRASGRVRVVPTAARPPAPRLPAARVRRF